MKPIYSCLLLILLAGACSKIDNSYKNFIEPGGRVYVESANKAVALPGYYKIDILWPKMADPNVTSAKIFWNNYADSVAINITPQQDTIHAAITGLQEQYYTFTIITYDNNNNRSVPVEITGRSIGDNYLASLSNRYLQSASQTAGSLTLDWGGAPVYNGAIGVQVFYTDNTGASVYKFVPNDETTTVIFDYSDTTQFNYRTLFKADTTAVDTIFTSFQTVDEIRLDKTKWSVIAFDAQHTGPENAASNMIDGTFTTRWHTAVPGPSYPHFIIVDMGAERTISKFSLERTNKDVPAGDDRGPDTIEFLIGNDTTQLKSLGVFNFNRLVNGEQYFPVTNATGRYFKFVGLTGPQFYMVLGEVSAYGF